MRIRNGLFCLAIGVYLVTGCATPPASYYTLNPLAVAHEQPVDVALLVERVTIPPMLDRPHLVRQHGADQVVFDEFHRWAAPLRGEITRVISMNLATLLGTSRIGIYPETADLRGEDALYRVQVDITRVTATLGESVRLEALWRIQQKGNPDTRSGHTQVVIPAPEASNNALAAAHSAALLHLSEEISQAIQAMPQQP